MLKHYLYLPKAEKQTDIFHGDAEGFPMKIFQQDHPDSMPGVSSSYSRRHKHLTRNRLLSAL
jgi:hypothetical protein